MLLRSVYYLILVLLKRTSMAYVTCYGNQCGGLLQKEDTSVEMIFFQQNFQCDGQKSE